MISQLPKTGSMNLNCLRMQLPDVVILDIIMSDKEGFETLVEMRCDYPDLKIIAISGGGSIGATNYLILAEALGANLTIEKPIHMQELLAAIRQLCPCGSPFVKNVFNPKSIIMQ